MQNRGMVIALSLGSIGLVATANADIVGVGGMVQEISAPADARDGALANNSVVFAWNEQQNVMLDGDLLVDITGPGTYAHEEDLNSGVIKAGTIVSSHMIHFDTIRSSEAYYRGTISFDGDILGVIVTWENLDGSDVVGSPTTMYQKGQGRGLENVNANGMEFVTWEDNNLVLNISGRVQPVFDEIRIITSTVPAPGAIGLMATAGGCFLMPRRRRQA